MTIQKALEVLNREKHLDNEWLLFRRLYVYSRWGIAMHKLSIPEALELATGYEHRRATDAERVAPAIDRGEVE